MQSLIWLIITLIDLYVYVLIAMVVMSWLFAFNVINYNNQFVRQLSQVITQLTEPVLAPIRRILPNMGGIDLSPMVLLLGLFFVKNLILEYSPRLM
ncbi:MAG TPA: YggT family protein [Rhizobiales bacterium]|nr:YggT family protein [Hyphomicrobiales bacterium]